MIFFCLESESIHQHHKILRDSYRALEYVSFKDLANDFPRSELETLTQR